MLTFCARQVVGRQGDGLGTLKITNIHKYVGNKEDCRLPKCWRLGSEAYKGQMRMVSWERSRWSKQHIAQSWRVLSAAFWQWTVLCPQLLEDEAKFHLCHESPRRCKLYVKAMRSHLMQEQECRMTQKTGTTPLSQRPSAPSWMLSQLQIAQPTENRTHDWAIGHITTGLHGWLPRTTARSCASNSWHVPYKPTWWQLLMHEFDDILACKCLRLFSSPCAVRVDS